jgi:hypothetical protein
MLLGSQRLALWPFLSTLMRCYHRIPLELHGCRPFCGVVAVSSISGFTAMHWIRSFLTPHLQRLTSVRSGAASTMSPLACTGPQQALQAQEALIDHLQVEDLE